MTPTLEKVLTWVQFRNAQLTILLTLEVFFSLIKLQSTTLINFLINNLPLYSLLALAKISTLAQFLDIKPNIFLALEIFSLPNILYLTIPIGILVNSLFWNNLPTLEIIDLSYISQWTISISIPVIVLSLIKL